MTKKKRKYEPWEPRGRDNRARAYLIVSRTGRSPEEVLAEKHRVADRLQGSLLGGFLEVVDDVEQADVVVSVGDWDADEQCYEDYKQARALNKEYRTFKE